MVWEILTKNLITFKRWDEIKDEKIEYYEGSLKNQIFRGVHKKQYIGGNCLKRGAWPVCSAKKRWAFLRGGDTSMHTMHSGLSCNKAITQLVNTQLIQKQISQTFKHF